MLADEPVLRKIEKLYRLPISGDWITLSAVRKIVASPGFEVSGKRYLPRVNIVVEAPPSILDRTGAPGESWHTIECETIEEAYEIRDRIAADRNDGF
jgi:hypothetical protein